MFPAFSNILKIKITLLKLQKTILGIMENQKRQDKKKKYFKQRQNFKCRNRITGCQELAMGTWSLLPTD